MVGWSFLFDLEGRVAGSESGGKHLGRSDVPQGQSAGGWAP